MLSILILVLAAASQICEAIVHGQPAKQGDFPYAVRIFRKKDGTGPFQFFCTGSIICENKILTAGHCAQVHGVDQTPDVYYGRVGSVYLNEGQKIYFEKVQHHPAFHKKPFLNDLSIFTTTEPIVFDEYTKPVCLADKDTDIDKYLEGIAMGWGLVEKRGSGPEHPNLPTHLGIPNHMQYVIQKVLPYEECKNVEKKDYHVPDNMTKTQICTTETNPDIRQATCKGDSGGPLVHIDENGEDENEDVQSHVVGTIQFGITSAGSHHCGVIPTDSTRISAYNDFIKEQTAGCNICFR